MRRNDALAECGRLSRTGRRMTANETGGPDGEEWESGVLVRFSGAGVLRTGMRPSCRNITQIWLDNKSQSKHCAACCCRYGIVWFRCIVCIITHFFREQSVLHRWTIWHGNGEMHQDVGDDDEEVWRDVVYTNTTLMCVGICAALQHDLIIICDACLPLKHAAHRIAHI